MSHRGVRLSRNSMRRFLRNFLDFGRSREINFVNFGGRLRVRAAAFVVIIGRKRAENKINTMIRKNRVNREF